MTELDRRDPRTLLEQLVRHREATYEELAEQFNTLAESWRRRPPSRCGTCSASRAEIARAPGEPPAPGAYCG